MDVPAEAAHRRARRPRGERAGRGGCTLGLKAEGSWRLAAGSRVDVGVNVGYSDAYSSRVSAVPTPLTNTVYAKPI
ncbi:hypothetical protein NOVOSPHI9U_40331 [Novosphingobium sp. 9U]|nr:hypothetical protein NOVOSPHI9U_40331 [Novosphingobium sp. 9U]